MTPRRHASVIAAIAAASLVVAGCKSVPHPFQSRPKVSRASPGQRISLLELNDQLKVSDALKGQDFFLPAPAPQAEWPLAVGGER
jgi:hypothetical protein